MRDYRRLDELRPYVEQAQQMSGWTFAYLPQPLGDPPPWDYEQRARALAAEARTLLDMGTGGGEVLSRILAGYGGRAVATEEWALNVPVAARKLQPLGAAVLHAESYKLPFADGTFDLVLDRHEALIPAEVARVLAPGGRVLTQQIHPDWHAELRVAFPRMTRFEAHHETYPAGFADAGLNVVDFQEHAQPVAYRHLGEIVYMLVAAPWTVPDFDLEADLDALLEMERTLRQPEGLVLTDRRYILEAHKPGYNMQQPSIFGRNSAQDMGIAGATRSHARQSQSCNRFAIGGIGGSIEVGTTGCTQVNGPRTTQHVFAPLPTTMRRTP